MRFLDGKHLPKPPDHREHHKQVAGRLRQWVGSEDEPDKLIVPLEHACTPADLSFERLKGRDAAVASVPIGASEEAACDLHLALLSTEESGSATYGDNYRGRRWRSDDEDAFVVDEVPIGP